MPKTLLSLKPEDSHAPARGRGRPSKIDRGEWPRIVERRAAGEPISAIARDYGVTPGAISNILKKAAEVEPVAGEAESGADVGDDFAEETAGPGPMGAPKPERESAPAEEAEAVPAEPPDPPRDAPPARDERPVHSARSVYGEAESHPLARRLMEAASACAEALERGGSPGDVAEHAQEVRRALAAIEIAQAKSDTRSRPKAWEPAPESFHGEEAGDDEADTGAGTGSGRRGGSQRRESGTVKFYNAEKGFGFITPDDGSQDVYVPNKAVEQSGLGRLRQGARVSYTVRQGAKSPEAQDLRWFDS